MFEFVGQLLLVGSLGRHVDPKPPGNSKVSPKPHFLMLHTASVLVGSLSVDGITPFLRAYILCYYLTPIGPLDSILNAQKGYDLESSIVSKIKISEDKPTCNLIC